MSQTRRKSLSYTDVLIVFIDEAPAWEEVQSTCVKDMDAHLHKNRLQAMLTGVIT